MAEDRPALTVAQAIEEYLDWQALDRGRSPNTVRAYGIDLAGLRAFAGAAGVEQLAEVDRDLLREFQGVMARGRRGGRPLSPQTRHRRLVALRSFLRFCAREDWTPGDVGVASTSRSSSPGPISRGRASARVHRGSDVIAEGT